MKNPANLSGIDADLREHIKKRCRELRRKSTPAEKRLWQAVRNRQIEGVKFYRQAPLVVKDRGDPQFYIADFYVDECQLVVEIDGEIHQNRKEYDRWRTLLLNQYDVKIVRWKNDVIVNNITSVMNELSEVIKERKRYFLD